MPDGFPKFTLEGVSVNSLQDADVLVSNVGKEPDTTCDCKVRTKPPPMPEKIPFPAHETEKIKTWLLERYSASTFNTCTRQGLLTMEGEPVKIFIKEGSKPHVVHMPAPIPIHFRN